MALTPAVSPTSASNSARPRAAADDARRKIARGGISAAPGDIRTPVCLVARLLLGDAGQGAKITRIAVEVIVAIALHDAAVDYGPTKIVPRQARSGDGQSRAHTVRDNHL